MPGKSRLPKYQRDKQGNPIVFDVVSVQTGEIVASFPSRVAARNHIAQIDSGDGENYALRIRTLSLPAEDRSNEALREFEETLRKYGVGLFLRCTEPNTGSVFELWRTLTRKPLILFVQSDGSFGVFFMLADSSDRTALHLKTIREAAK